MDVSPCTPPPLLALAAMPEPRRATMVCLQIFKEAQDLLPGGVNSPVRAFKSVGGGPIVFDRVKGPYCWDVDGNKYIDYIGSWGPAIVGAARDEVNEVLKAQVEKGTSFGAPCALEVRMRWAWTPPPPLAPPCSWLRHAGCGALPAGGWLGRGVQGLAAPWQSAWAAMPGRPVTPCTASPPAERAGQDGDRARAQRGDGALRQLRH